MVKKRGVQLDLILHYLKFTSQLSWLTIIDLAVSGGYLLCFTSLLLVSIGWKSILGLINLLLVSEPFFVCMQRVVEKWGEDLGLVCLQAQWAREQPNRFT
jgi:hypothetical protein